MAEELMPWFTKGALDYIKGIDFSNMDIWEWGTGYSTFWFAQRCKSIITVDNDEKWRDNVSVLTQGLNNVEFNVKEMIPCVDCDYVQTINRDDKKYDVIIIDGRNRVLCCYEAIKHIKSKTIVIFDNTDRAEYNPGIELLNNNSSSVAEYKDDKKSWKTTIFIMK